MATRWLLSTLLATALLLPAPAAVAQAMGPAGAGEPGGISVTPGIDVLEGQIIHWVGPQQASVQRANRERFLEAHTRDIVLPFPAAQTDNCRLTKAALIIRRDGTGQFEATTLPLASNTDVAWHTTITVRDKRDRTLFGTGDVFGPQMNEGNASTPYVWVNKFTMDRKTMLKVYDDIDHASLIYGC